MYAVEIRGLPDKGYLEYGQHPMPMAKAGEVLIRVGYVGVNRADLLQRDGRYPAPADASPLPGLEVSGTIHTCGDGVSGWQIGDAVCALLSGGGYAEYVAVHAGQVLSIPRNCSLKEAAAIPEAAATSVMALHQQAGLKAGERVLIHGGTSGLGLMMIQIAHAWGAEVYTTVGSHEKQAFLEPYGVTAINHKISSFHEQFHALTNNEGMDVIIDTLGAPQLEAHLGLLRHGGRLVTLAMMEGARVENARIGRLLTHHLCWKGATLRSRTAAEKAEIMELAHRHIWPHLETGAIKPVVDTCFALSDAEKALTRMQERLHLGKILLEVQSE